MQHITTARTKFADYLVGLVLITVPFHAFLTVWLSTAVGHYTLLRLWDDALLAVLMSIVGMWLIRDASLRRWLGQKPVVKLIAAYMALSFVLGAVSLLRGDVTPKALSYGLLVNVRFLVWFVAVMVLAYRSNAVPRQWLRLVLIPAAVVVTFGLLQYFILPHDFLAHFGYSAHSTITPVETINNNPRYIRVASTLRGANPLGAYLIVVISACVLQLVKRNSRKRVAWALYVLVCLLVLFASGSRSAWIGTVLALAVLCWFTFTAPRSRRVLVVVAGIGSIVFGASILALRNDVGLQNAILHTQKHSAVTTGSNSAHAGALVSGLKDVIRQPLGDGPGTAGPASEYNGAHPARIAEDYYVQVAQETGWLGLALFIGISGLVGTALYRQSTRNRLALMLFASLIGLTFVNLLSHAWTDDTLAFVWWGLAGLALGGAEHEHAESE